MKSTGAASLAGWICSNDDTTLFEAKSGLNAAVTASLFLDLTMDKQGMDGVPAGYWRENR